MGYAFPLYPPNNPKNEKFKTMKKRSWDIILHMRTKNNNHMLYCSWDIGRVGCNSFFNFEQFLALLLALAAQKIKISKNEDTWRYHHLTQVYQKSWSYAISEKWKLKKNEQKKTPGDIIFHKCTKSPDHMLYYSWDMVHDRCNYFLF